MTTMLSTSAHIPTPHTTPSTKDAHSTNAAPLPAIDLQHVSVHYGDVHALRDVSLSINEGEYLCVVGSNGSGKSTLGTIMCGLLAPDEGHVCLLNECVYSNNAAHFGAYSRAQQQLGLVFQNPDDQIITSVVEEDIAFGPENLGLPSDEIERRVEREIARCALQTLAKRNPAQLSGGQKQRVAIAGALAMNPRIVVFDEPASQLDVRGHRAIVRVMRRLAKSGCTIIHITHCMEDVLEAQRVLVLHNGTLTCDCEPQALFARARELAAYDLQLPYALDLLRNCITNGSVTAPSKETIHTLCSVSTLPDHAYAYDIVQAQVARYIATHMRNSSDISDVSDVSNSARTPAPLGENTHTPASCSTHASAHTNTHTQAHTSGTTITLNHVSFSYSHRQQPALVDLTLTIPHASHVAVIGQTGSGKSTLVRLLSGLDVPTNGTITYTPHAKRGYIMQYPERQLFAQTVLDDVAFGLLSMGLSPHDAHERAYTALEQVELANKAQASPFELSRGQQRRVAIAGVLAMKPQVLITDELTSGLDPHAQAHIERLMDELHGTMVHIDVTHSMQRAARADMVVVLNEGALVSYGTPQQVFSNSNAAHLSEIGLGLPYAVAMRGEFARYGITLLDDALTKRALADAIIDARADDSICAAAGVDASSRPQSNRRQHV
ncbi:cobalt ABC transporter, ATP-binding protein [Fannyhessea vaginae PB189-T1-4]|uniref:Cobalt ABC transporter, ATP-binding protein n=1 Tax=Fannyhessea vaginae PB189-T1-4 TaxID=866774 RepID=A0ABP2IXS5_9ACTN|nr:energy-coupling factor transporter ATPase [Fannyhessea vaginae]EFL43859.1 cobalt ABC transporter, ATP-binding protein [Fannyhessea vaginae PB189-T1-4]